MLSHSMWAGTEGNKSGLGDTHGYHEDSRDYLERVDLPTPRTQILLQRDFTQDPQMDEAQNMHLISLNT